MSKGVKVDSEKQKWKKKREKKKTKEGEHLLLDKSVKTETK